MLSIVLNLFAFAPAPQPRPITSRELCGTWAVSWSGAASFMTLDSLGGYREWSESCTWVGRWEIEGETIIFHFRPAAEPLWGAAVWAVPLSRIPGGFSGATPGNRLLMKRVHHAQEAIRSGVRHQGDPGAGRPGADTPARPGTGACALHGQGRRRARAGDHVIRRVPGCPARLDCEAEDPRPHHPAARQGAGEGRQPGGRSGVALHGGPGGGAGELSLRGG